MKTEVLTLKTNIMFLTAVLLLFSLCGPLCAGESEKAEAENIGRLLAEKFAPESLDVTVAAGGKLAWIEMSCSRQGGVRVASMKLLARLKEQPGREAAGGRKLASLVESSDGEIELLEKDVNDYFASAPVQSGGLSNLKFDFRPQGFTARGVYTTTMIFEIKLDVEADGKLGLRSDGLYIEEPVVRAEGIRQPDLLTKQLIGRINPLLSFSTIPFPVRFTSVTMTEDAVVMSGAPKPPAEGEKWTWRR